MVCSTSFPGSFISPPYGGGEMKDPGNEVVVWFGFGLFVCIPVANNKL